MSALSAIYTVSDVIPVPIWPSGLQGDYTIINSGTATILIGDAANRAMMIPLLKGNTAQWPSNRPLYTALDAPNTLSQITVVPGQVLFAPSTITLDGPVSITGAVSIGQVTGTVTTQNGYVAVYRPGDMSLAAHLANRTHNVRGLATITLMINANTQNTTSGGNLAFVWLDEDGYVIDGGNVSDVYSISTGTEMTGGVSGIVQYRITIPVRGAQMMTTWTPYTVGVPNTLTTQRVTIFGSAAAGSRGFRFTPGSPPSNWVFFNRGVDLTTMSLSTTTMSSFSDTIPVVNGDAALDFTISGPGRLSVQAWPLVANFNVWAEDLPGAGAYHRNITLPGRACRVTWTNNMSSMMSNTYLSIMPRSYQ